MTDDPIRDAEHFFEKSEQAFYEENKEKCCEICGRPCARLKHYEFDDVIVCDNDGCIAAAFKRLLIPADVIDDMIYEYEVRG